MQKAERPARLNSLEPVVRRSRFVRSRHGKGGADISRHPDLLSRRICL